jgi:putative transposase
VWPQILETLVLVKPATVIKWHRKGFRIYWRWRSSCPGRPKIGDEVRDLIRRMSIANPLALTLTGNDPPVLNLIDPVWSKY